MVFKPFKPPLIRKQSQSDPTPPAKKQRLSKDDANSSQIPDTERDRKPLLQLKNPSETDGCIQPDNESEEKYYNVLWSVIHWSVLVSAS